MLSGGQAATQAMSFLRNIIIARLIGPEHMGIAALFAVTVSVLEMISNLAVDMLLIQDKDGDDPRFQGTAHTFQLVRGILSGLMIFMVAPLVTELFNIPETEWAFRLLGLAAVFRGAMHLDWKRMQRFMDYRSTVTVELIPQAIATLIAYPLAVKLNDFSVVLWIVLLQSLLGLVVSHWVADRSYKVMWERVYGLRMLTFGWPLLLNGLLIFGAMQGDRVTIGTFFTMRELGLYSVAISLVLVAITVLTKISTSLLLPVLSRKTDNQKAFEYSLDRYSQGMAVLAGIAALPFCLSGGELVTVIFGDQYSDGLEFVPYLGILLAIRVFRLVPTIAALSRADTKNSLYANCYRFLGVVAAFGSGWLGADIVTIIICGISGEVLALLFTQIRLYRLADISFKKSITPPIAVILVVSLLWLSVNKSGSLLVEQSNGILLIFLCVLLYFTVCLAILPMIRNEVISYLNTFWDKVKVAYNI